MYRRLVVSFVVITTSYLHTSNNYKKLFNTSELNPHVVISVQLLFNANNHLDFRYKKILL